MSRPPTTIFVCISCRVALGGDDRGFEKPGVALARSLQNQVAASADIEVRAVECLSVCKRPATIAFAGPDKWTYVIGGIDESAEPEIIGAAEAYGASADGIVPWKERPAFFQKGVVARVPPATYRLTEKSE